MKIIFMKRFGKWLALGFVLMIMMVYLLYFNDKPTQVNQTNSEVLLAFEEEPEIQEQVNEELQKELVVDVKGAVVNEGVYYVQQGDRVIDVIQMAGGFIQTADKTKVNLAKLLTDEMVIYIPKIGEITEAITENQNQSKKININIAQIGELEKLPGIGPSKAAAIISYRKEIGLFKNTEDIMNVTGIGKSTYEKVKEEITVR